MFDPLGVFSVGHELGDVEAAGARIGLDPCVDLGERSLVLRRAHHVHVPGRADRHVRLEGMQEEEAQEGREERERRMRKTKAPVQHVRTQLSLAPVVPVGAHGLPRFV